MMTELSLNVLDIAQNSIKARASLVRISVSRDTAARRLSISVEDNGCGMTPEQVEHVIDPFFTTRTTRKVGLGVPFFKLSAELTGGSFRIQSREGEGTSLRAEYCYDHIDMLPLGDMASTMTTLISVNPDIDFVYAFDCDGCSFEMDTRAIRELIGEVPINAAEVLAFIRDFITGNQAEADHPETGGPVPGTPLSERNDMV